MEYNELTELIATRFKQAGLDEYIVKERSQLLEFPEEYFAEVVLNDGSRVDQAQQILAEIAAEQIAQNTKLDYIVRSVWQVEEVELAPDYRSDVIADVMKGGIFSLRFVATLTSGPRVQNIGVEITPSALEELRRLGDPSDEESLKNLVHEFLELQLSFGGESYWDPVRYPSRQLNDGAVLHLHYHPVHAA